MKKYCCASVVLNCISFLCGPIYIVDWAWCRPRGWSMCRRKWKSFRISNKIDISAKVDTHNRCVLTWNQRWELLLPILNTSWKDMKQLKEVTCSVVLSPSSGNHWNTAGGTGICSYCVSKCVSRLLSVLCGWDPSLPIFAVFSLKCMSMCDVGVQLLWWCVCVCVCVREIMLS